MTLILLMRVTDSIRAGRSRPSVTATSRSIDRKRLADVVTDSHDTTVCLRTAHVRVVLMHRNAHFQR